MTATEKLRAMLDERGVEWKEHIHTMPGSMAIQRETLWGQPIDNTNRRPIPHVYHCRATEMGDGRLFLEAQLVTPEQAIAATLGAGTCEDLGGTDANGRDVFNCSGCGCVLSLYDIDGSNNLCTSFIFDYPHFCPECGARVVRS